MDQPARHSAPPAANDPYWKTPPPEAPKTEGRNIRLSRLAKWGARVGAIGMILTPTELADETLPYWLPDLNSPDPIRRRTAEEAQRRYTDNPALRPELEEWFHEETKHLPRPQPNAQTTEDNDADTGQQVRPSPELVSRSERDIVKNVRLTAMQ